MNFKITLSSGRTYHIESSSTLMARIAGRKMATERGLRMVSCERI